MNQPTALFLADILEDAGKPADIADKCAAELRRLYAENELLHQRHHDDNVEYTGVDEMTQPTALWLADWLDVRACGGDNWNATMNAAAAELRRLVAQRDALLEALKKLDTFFETYRPEDHPVSDPHELVRAAIKKAEENT